MPVVIAPMSVGHPEPIEDDSAWATEIKWDGVRAIAFCENGTIRLQGMRQNDITDLFPEIEKLGEVENAQGTILDGELVAFGERGIPSFRKIQARLRPEPIPPGERPLRSYLATFVIFDLLWMEGEDLRDLPYHERRRRLESLKLAGATWETPDYLIAEIEPTLEATAIQELEGLVIKRLDSPYVSGNSDNPFWKKLKTHPRQELVIGGWIPAFDGQPGALMVGYWESFFPGQEHLRFAGLVTEGFSHGDIDVIEADLENLERPDSPFSEATGFEGVRFSNPLRVVELGFRQWSEDGLLVDPFFIALRRDKDPGEVRREPIP